ncbi:MAG: hypothetical protein ACPGYP_06090 [Solirubrobacterales bacterium]
MPKRVRINKKDRIKIAIALIGALALVAAASIQGLTAADDQPVVDAGASVSDDACFSGGVLVQGDANCTKVETPPKSEPKLNTADAGCGSVEGDVGKRDFDMHVLMWCAPEAVRGQYQFKLKLSITNNANRRLDIRQGRFALVWKSLDPRKWSPPPDSNGPVPKRVRYEGLRYWAIFSNPDGAAEYRPQTDDYTFATHWSNTFLGPGKVSIPPNGGDRELNYQDQSGVLKTITFSHNEDDLVFYVPKETVDKEENFLGLAYIDGSDVIALCPQSSWGPKVPPSAF